MSTSFHNERSHHVSPRYVTPAEVDRLIAAGRLERSREAHRIFGALFRALGRLFDLHGAMEKKITIVEPGVVKRTTMP